MQNDMGIVFRHVMSGAREVLELTGSGERFRMQIEALEEYVYKNPALAIDLAKTLVETACKTILSDKGKSGFDNNDLPALVKEVLNSIQLLPDGYSGKQGVRDAVKKTINGLVATITGLCELRNEEGTASHGKDAHAKTLDSIHGLLAAQAAEAVICFLFKVHKNYSEDIVDSRKQYDDFKDFNGWIDRGNAVVKIFSYEYSPSEVLFYVDRTAYDDIYANEYDESSDEGDV